MEDDKILKGLTKSTLEQVSSNVDKFLLANKRRKTQYEINLEEQKKKMKANYII